KLFLLLYVDAVIVKGSNPSHVLELVLQLRKEFTMNDLGPLHFFLKIEVKYFQGGIQLNQSKYVSELLAKTEMTLAKVVATLLAKKYGFHEVVGRSLQYFTLTRPIITHVVNLVVLYTFYSELFHNHHEGFMATQMLIREVVPQLGDQLQVVAST
uniref:Reverse transcriptase Ty1/copia-type domain-containing protein n=1 Tax=Solanum lycopersicum TaxID=4081 RepID=A0A3Q7IGW6_SOLLC